MKAVILARVSTEMQEDGFSLDAQLDRLRRYCERHNLDIIQEYNITESSTKGKRPQFNEMLTFVKKQRERIAVVVDAVDRLQRSFKETPILNDLIEQGKIELHFLREAMVVNDRTKNTQKVMWDMCVLMAKAYVGALADNVKRAEEKMLKEGLLAGPAPIGYLNTRDENGKKTIIIDPDRGHFIKKLFEEYSTGLFSMDELVKKSKSWGLRNKTTAHNPISKSQFANILQNPFYYGVMYYNKEYHPHCYEKLISKELFDKCTEVRTGKFKRTSKHTKEPYIFRGLVRCKHCGCLLSPYTKKDKYVYLRHTDLKNCEHCNNVSEKVLLKDVEKSLSSIHFDDDLKAALAVRLKKQYEATHGNTYYQLEKNRNELADVEENQKKLLDLLISGTVPAEVYRSKNAEYETAKIELQAKIEKLQMPDTSVERAIDKVLNFSQNSFAIFKSSQIEEKRRILNIVFANFFMDGKNPEISMRKNFKLLSKIGACEDWCSGEDSNFHCLRQHAPEACASTNFATRASITDILLSHFKINCKHLFQKIIKISIRI